MALESKSIPGTGVIIHEAGDTLRRTFIIKANGVEVDLSSATVEMIISYVKDGAPIATLTMGAGLVASNLLLGEVKVFWQTAGILYSGKEYYYKLRVTYSDGRIKTYLEDKFKTK